MLDMLTTPGVNNYPWRILPIIAYSGGSRPGGEGGRVRVKGRPAPPPQPLDPPLAYTERLCRNEYESAGISPVEVYERVGISVISVCKKAQKGQQVHFVAVKKSKKRSGVVVNS